MQAVVLAAGMGRRLGKLTERSTKFMVPVNGRPLAGYALDAMVDAGVDRIVLVVGHGADEVREYVGAEHRGVPVEYVVNAEYATTNNIQSLLLAREYLEQDDTLLLESDLIFEPEVLAECVASPAPTLAVVAQHEPWMDGTVVLLDEHGHIAEFVSKRDF